MGSGERYIGYPFTRSLGGGCQVIKTDLIGNAEMLCPERKYAWGNSQDKTFSRTILQDALQPVKIDEAALESLAKAFTSEVTSKCEPSRRFEISKEDVLWWTMTKVFTLDELSLSFRALL